MYYSTRIILVSTVFETVDGQATKYEIGYPVSHGDLTRNCWANALLEIRYDGTFPPRNGRCIGGRDCQSFLWWKVEDSSNPSAFQALFANRNCFQTNQTFQLRLWNRKSIRDPFFLSAAILFVFVYALSNHSSSLPVLTLSWNPTQSKSQVVHS